ncbi:MAG: hypothetical protein JSR46_07850, partial [Verrucomicrobia bacterium]|nr:hypothetical protein [Verrucomicrobiota bacterium]
TNENFILQSESGVTLSQIDHLATAFDSQRVWAANRKLVPMVAEKLASIDTINYKDALYCYWQMNPKQTLDQICRHVKSVIRECDKATAYTSLGCSSTYGGELLLNKFQNRYLKIKPERHYNKDLAETIRAQKTTTIGVKIPPSDTAIKVDNTSQAAIPTVMSEQSEKCIICCEKIPVIVFDPCGHLSYCQTCYVISKIAACSICKKPIEKTIEIFKAGMTS